MTKSLKPNNWLRTHVEYSGRGIAEFSDPAGTVEGNVKAVFDEFGRATIEMQVDCINSDVASDLTSFMSVKDGNVVGALNPCGRISVSTVEGEFSATKKIRIAGMNTRLFAPPASGEKDTLGFHLIWSKFASNNQNAPKYWVLPLTNFISPLRTRFDELDRHPLRIFPTPEIPDDASQEDLLRLHSKNQIAGFSVEGKTGFVERLADYDERKQRLVDGDVQRLLTAVMVGSLDGAAIDFFEPENWFPVDYLLLLSLATGNRVGAPWLELRDAHCDLVERIHINFGTPTFTEGRPLIDEWVNPGAIGHLITKAADLKCLADPSFRIPLVHLVECRTSHLSLDGWMAQLCRAFEHLHKQHGLSAVDLTSKLSSANQSCVTQMLQDVASEIRELITSSSDNAERAALDTISQRVTNARNRENKFGLSLIELLTLYDLPDATVVERHYRQYPRTDGQQWYQPLSNFRGAVIHDGHFDFGGIHDIAEVSNVVIHLQDILTRVVLKKAGFQGQYINHQGIHVLVDWVKDDTPVAQLGYGNWTPVFGTTGRKGSGSC